MILPLIPAKREWEPVFGTKIMRKQVNTDVVLRRHRVYGQGAQMMHSIAQMLDPAAWAAMFGGGWGELDQTTFWLAFLKIVWINVLLSGDNAVVIALACRGLPPRQRLWGMILGAGVAVLLRVVFTGVVASLMLLPYLKIVGGLALFYIAAKLLVPDDPEEDGAAPVQHLWRAVRIVAVADIIMSLDNVIAIAAAAEGNMALLGAGPGGQHSADRRRRGADHGACSTASPSWFGPAPRCSAGSSAR